MKNDKKAANEISKEAELTDTLKHLQADFENYKKRIEKELAIAKENTKAQTIGSLLPIIDTFEVALQKRDHAEEFKKGVELIYAQIVEFLKQNNVRKIETANQKFDPYKHEALLTKESNETEGTILEELQPGYMINDKVVRYAKVSVAKRGTDESKNS